MEGLKNVAAITLILIFFYSISHGQAAYIPPEKPKLVVGIIVEQLRYDQIARFSDRYGDKGIRRLMNEGTSFRNASYQSMLMESAPAHATISTGTEPSWHGITSDSWYFPLRNELVYCTQDPGVDPAGGGYEAGLHSPLHMVASTFTDELKMATSNEAKVFGVGLKEHTAILSAGHAADAAYWYENSTGNWISSTWYIDSLPSWVNDFNAMLYPLSYLTRIWDLSRPMHCYYDCVSDTSLTEIGFDGRNYFPYDLKKLNNNMKINPLRESSFIRETPYGNSLTTDFTKKLIEMEDIGKDDIPDFLTVCYSTTENIGLRFGPSSYEMADAIIRLDKEIEDLLDYLVDSVGKQNILVYFTSAHGIAEIPSVLTENRIPAGYFRIEQVLYLLRSYLKLIYGDGDWVKGYTGRQVYLNRTLIEDSDITIEEVQKTAARFLVQVTGVSSAYPFSEFVINDFGAGNLKRIINSYHPQRSGDIIITLNPGWVEAGSDIATNHSTSYDYDSHIPLIWFGWSVDRASVSREVSMTDIAPTLSTLVNVPFPNACTGEPLFELFR